MSRETRTKSAAITSHRNVRAGREVRYRVTPQPLATAVGWILDTAGLWDIATLPGTAGNDVFSPQLMTRPYLRKTG